MTNEFHCGRSFQKQSLLDVRDARKESKKTERQVSVTLVRSSNLSHVTCLNALSYIVRSNVSTRSMNRHGLVHE